MDRDPRATAGGWGSLAKDSRTPIAPVEPRAGKGSSGIYECERKRYLTMDEILRGSESMGVIHFLLVGGSPGAATVGLSYCVKNYRRWKLQQREILEGAVLVTTPEIINGTHGQKSAVLNEYGSTTGGREVTGKTTLDVVEKYINGELGSLIEVNGGRIDHCITYVDKFKESILSLAEKLLAFSDKEVWLNITGSINTMTATAVFTAFCGGTVAKIYYTYMPSKCSRLLQPCSDEFSFFELPVLKSELDPKYFGILELLGSSEQPERKLKDRLKAGGIICDTKTFQKMAGQGVLNYDRQRGTMRITEAGKMILDLYQNQTFKDFVGLMRRQW